MSASAPGGWKKDDFSAGADANLLPTWTNQDSQHILNNKPHSDEVVTINARSKSFGGRLVAMFSKASGRRLDDDIFDKLNYHYTTLFLLVLLIIVAAKLHLGQSAKCWTPATFTDQWTAYVENYCPSSGSYFLSLDEVPREFAERENRRLAYHEWTPFVLALQALFFCAPMIVWRMISSQSDMHIQSLVKMASIASPDTVAGFRNLMRITAKIRGASPSTAVVPQTRRRQPGGGTAVSTAYIGVKLFYCVNLLVQIILIDAFLSSFFHFYGFRVIFDMILGYEWPQNYNFPNVAMCDFEVRVLGNVHHHTVQCAMVINGLCEKVFLFVWFWLVLLFLATGASLFYWLIASMSPDSQISFVKKYLTNGALEHQQPIDPQLLRRFTLTYLKPDGVFLLRMVSLHAGDTACYDLVSTLWNDFSMQ